MSIERSLHSLRDIEGVYGSFIVDADGRTTARDLPAVFDDYALAESGERIVRLWEVLCENGEPEYALMEFAEYSLFLRGVCSSGALPRAGGQPTLTANDPSLPAPVAPEASGCLCVVVPPSVNLLALRLASKWVARSIDRDAPRPSLA